MSPLAEQIKQIAENFSSQETETSKRYLERLKESDRLTRDDANPSHFCVYFLPFNPKTKQVFIIHHKKSGLWLSPGGHIDKNESILDALSREIKEELGLINFFSILPKPFLITITPISNPIQPCTEHLDIWFLLETDGNNFNVDPQEFHNFKWMTLNEAEQIITDKANIKAINFLNSH
jgi:8-oxo-dGTP pyrophosphatase MutT (NUDIX family)